MSNLIFKTIGGQTYWFTSALVVAELLILLMLFSRRKNIWFYAIFSILIGACGIWMAQNDIAVLHKNWWAYRQGLIAIMFLAFGGLYWRYETSLGKLLRWWASLLLLGLLIAVILLCEGTDPLISTLTIQPLGVLTSLVSCVLLVQLCKLLPEVKALTFIGRNSIGFYFMSGALPITFSMVAHKMFSNTQVYTLFAVWVLCMLVAYVAVRLINRWFPWLFDLRSMAARNRTGM